MPANNRVEDGLSVAERFNQPKTEPPSSGYYGCPACGRTVAAADPNCQHCGAGLKGNPSVVVQQTTPSRSGAMIVVGLILFAIAAGVIAQFDLGTRTADPLSDDNDGVVTSNGWNPSHDSLVKLGRSGRNPAFTKTLTGEGCQVRDNEWRGIDKEGVSWWTLSCTSGKRFLLSVQRNATGSTRGLDCDVAKVVKVDCDTWMGGAR